MADLQKSVRGYSDFIGRYTGGQLGLQDSNVLVPVLDMADFLNERKNQAFQVNFTAAGQYASIVVPSGKRWRLHHAAATFVAAAGQAAHYSVVYVKSFGGAQYFGYFGDRDTTGLNSGVRFMNQPGFDHGIGYDTDFIFDAGDEVGVTINHIAAGAGNFFFTFFCQYTEWNI